MKTEKLILIIILLCLYAGLEITKSIKLRSELKAVKEVNQKLLSNAACKYWYNQNKVMR